MATPPVSNSVASSVSILNYRFQKPHWAALVIGLYLFGFMPFIAAFVSFAGFSAAPMVFLAVAGVVAGLTMRIENKLNLKLFKSILDVMWNCSALLTMGSIFYAATSASGEYLNSFLSQLPPEILTATFLLVFGTACLRVSVAMAEVRISIIEKRAGSK